MAEAVTIDNYDVKIHERYATDREAFDPIFIKEANLIPRHFEIAATESKLTSKWEELFETHIHHHPWATFVPPPKYAAMRNRFFSYTLSPDFNWVNQEEEESNEEEKKRQEAELVEEYKKKIQSKVKSSSLVEKEQKMLLSLIDSIQTLNGYLRDIHARRLQYQKG